MRALASADQGLSGLGRPYAPPATEFAADAESRHRFGFRMEAVLTISAFTLTLSYLSGALHTIGALITATS